MHQSACAKRTPHEERELDAALRELEYRHSLAVNVCGRARERRFVARKLATHERRAGPITHTDHLERLRQPLPAKC